MQSLAKLREYLLTGVSYAIPFIAAGGILIALSIAFVPMRPGSPAQGGGPDFSQSPRMKMVNDIGGASRSDAAGCSRGTSPMPSRAGPG